MLVALRSTTVWAAMPAPSKPRLRRPPARGGPAAGPAGRGAGRPTEPDAVARDLAAATRWILAQRGEGPPNGRAREGDRAGDVIPPAVPGHTRSTATRSPQAPSDRSAASVTASVRAASA